MEYYAVASVAARRGVGVRVMTTGVVGAKSRVHIVIVLIYIGWILNLTEYVECAVIIAERSDLRNKPAPLAIGVAQNSLHVNKDTTAVEEDISRNSVRNMDNWNGNDGHGELSNVIDFEKRTGKELANKNLNNGDIRQNPETEKLTMTEDDHGRAPVLELPEDFIDNNDRKNYSQSDNGENEGNQVVVMEYEPGIVIRCEAMGSPRPNVTWEYEGGRLPHYVGNAYLTYSHPQNSDEELHSKDDRMPLSSSEMEGSAWVDLRLPKINNAFYGRLRCRAENKYGNASWEIELIHNANSSLFMKLVRGTLASVFVLAGIVIFKGILWFHRRRKEKLYEKLPAQDLEIINKFKKGLAPPPPSPSSSIAPPGMNIGHTSQGGVHVPLPSCVTAIEITVTGDENGKCNTDAISQGYRPVKHVASSPDFQKRGGGASTPSSCVSVHVTDSVNSWTNYVPYNDKLETSSQHFKVDFAKMIENGSYGMVFAGKVRNDLTMEWSLVAVKTGKTERDDNFLLESILTELKILASLPKAHDYIVNLKGAYTKQLHKRQAFVFVDYCENGNLANFIDLNRKYFRDVSRSHPERVQDASSTATVASNNNLKSLSTKIEGNGPIAAFRVCGNGADQNVKESHQVVVNIEDKTLQTFSMKELLSWTWQIADAMSFLHKNRIIHGNLSTTNVYLTSKLTCKVGNIGYPPAESLSCIDETTKKWLTLPHFGFEQFSKKSDVSDYGQVIWEIFSLRDQPCPNKNTVLELLQNEQARSSRDGRSDGEFEGIEVPDHVTPEVFELMVLCWNDDGTFCPEFDFLVKAFKQIQKEMFPVMVTPKNETSPALNKSVPK